MQSSLLKYTRSVYGLWKRDIGVFAPALQKASDPIQQLFLDKLREYKSKTSGGKMELTPEMQKELDSDKQKLYKQYNVKPEEIAKFPSFNFPEPKIQKPNC